MPASAGLPKTSVTPMRPSAPGTSSQKAGRKVTCDGGPPRSRATPSATGVISNAPKNPLTSAPNRRSPATWPIQAAIATTSSHRSAGLGAEK
jgi:hypothetical protein